MGFKNWAFGALGLVTADQLKRNNTTRNNSIRKTLAQMASKVNARFDSAQTNDGNERHWANSDGLTANEAANPGVRQILRNRSRYEEANNSYYDGMTDTYADELIGDGPVLQVKTSSEVFNEAVEDAFHDWSEAVLLGEKLRLATKTKKRDGETFIQLFHNPNLPSVNKLDLRLIEADRVEEDPFQLADENTLDGIKYDAYGNPVSYKVAVEPINPNFGMMGTRFDLIRARDMIHWYKPTRPGQLRGLPELMSSLPLFAILRRYTLAVAKAAETAAAYNILLETQTSPDMVEDLVPMDSFDIEHDMMTTVPAGWNAHQMKAEQPTQQYGDFKREIVGEAARPINMPLNMATLNSSGYNFASGRLDHMAFDVTLKIERDDCRIKVLKHIFREWAREWGLIMRMSGQNTFVVPKDIDTTPHVWSWPVRRQADTLKEANTNKINIESGVESRQQIWRANGQDPAKMKAEVLTEREEFAEPTEVPNATSE